jgi:hypothetical protein
MRLLAESHFRLVPGKVPVGFAFLVVSFGLVDLGFLVVSLGLVVSFGLVVLGFGAAVFGQTTKPATTPLGDFAARTILDGQPVLSVLLFFARTYADKQQPFFLALYWAALQPFRRAHCALQTVALFTPLIHRKAVIQMYLSPAPHFSLVPGK